MTQIFIGYFLILIGVGVMTYGVTNELNSKMTHNLDMDMRIRTLVFSKGFVDDDGKKIEPITVLEFYKKKEE